VATLSVDQPLVIETPLMWIDKADNWRMAEHLGGEALVDLIRRKTHTWYVGNRTMQHGGTTIATNVPHSVSSKEASSLFGKWRSGERSIDQ